MTEEQWRAAWVLCEIAGDLEAEAQREYVRNATADPAVERQVIAILEELSSGMEFPPMPDRRIGDTVGRYVLIERIGHGGMGEVYSAEDTELNRQVALKFLPADLPSTAASSAQIIREARAASALNHPNIVTVYEIIQTQWGLAIVMELVEGQSLRALLKAQRLSRRQTIQMGRQMASALAAAHRKGIVHRDIKPENTMVRLDGYVKVLDFGLAQRIRERTLAGGSANMPVGTARYMSPEQKRGGEVTGASDIYSLALVLEEMSGWRHPLLTNMRAAAPGQRPSAEKVVSRLERFEQSSRYLAVAIGLAILTAISTFLAQSWIERSGPREPGFKQITRQTMGHDVTAAGLSPDGARLAYATVDGGLFIRDNRTASVRELDAPDGLAIYQLLFPANGGLLAVGARSDSAFEVWSIPADDSPPTRLREGVEAVALSHDGRQLAWLTQHRHEVWTGPLYGGSARLVFTSAQGERIPMIFWSPNDAHLWFHRMRGCETGGSPQDAFVVPDKCLSSDLVFFDPGRGKLITMVKDIRLTSGFFTTGGEFLFLRGDTWRGSNSYNLWSLHTDPRTGRIVSAPRQLSHFQQVRMAQLTGSRGGKSLAVVRTEKYDETYVAGWQGGRHPFLINPRRLTLEQTNNFPHAWTTDNQSVIFESNRNVHQDLFRQKLTRREAETLVSTPNDKWMPQVTPDGKWILYAAHYKSKSRYFLDPHRLMRIPVNGGTPVEVPIGGPLDEFRCSLPGRGTQCVLRTTGSGQQTYYQLDPVTGEGRELGRTTATVSGLGRWALSADGTRVDIPDDRHAGQFTELRLDPVPSRRSQSVKRIENFGIVNGINPVPSGNGWLVWGGAHSGQINIVEMPSLLEDPSRMEGLYYVDSREQPHLLYRSYVNTYGVFSPDEKHIAYLGIDLTSNAWMFKR